jgi:glucose-6-phosphate 1-dehydrogenase
MLHNTIMRDALLSNSTTRTMIQAKAEADHKAHKEHLARYKELKDLLVFTFGHRRQDVVYHALNRPDYKGSSSRLWYLASTPELFGSTKDVLQWAGTSEAAELKAKVLVNPLIED